MTTLLRPGDVLRIPEPHYLYGVGLLVLRVTQVGPVERLPDGEWLTVEGMQLGWNDTELHARRVLVRVSALRRGAGT